MDGRESQSRDPERLAVLDGLRGIAILLILVFHPVDALWDGERLPFLPVGPFDAGAVLVNGWIGVDLFFVLSGFLIGMHLLTRHFDENGRPAHLTVYFRRRLLRIYPAYFVVVTLYFSVICSLSLLPGSALPAHYLAHLFFLYDFFPPSVMLVLWSLAIEIKFYLLAPLLLFLILRLPRTRQRLAAAALLAATQPFIRFLLLGLHDPAFQVSWATFFELRRLFFSGSDGLLAGMFCALAYADARMRAVLCGRRTANMLFFGGLAAVAVLCERPHYLHVTLFEEIFFSLFLAGGLCGIMTGLLGGCAGAALFTGKILRFFARISYSLYLVHIPVMLLLLGLYAHALPGFSAWPSALRLIAFFPVFTALSVGFAVFLYREIEAPFIRLSHQSRRAAAGD